MKLIVYTDGGARGNPGNAGIGVHIVDQQGITLEKRYKNLGETTNNVAEYTGALYGIRRAIELGGKDIHLKMDSKLVIEQLQGNWKIKEEKLKVIAIEIQKLLKESQVQIHFEWIPREKNKVADELSNKAMDEA